MSRFQANRASRPAIAALLVGAAATLSGCLGGIPTNRSLYSENQPVVTRTNYVFDVMTSPSGVPVSEQQRLAGWFEAMDLGYGDKVAVDLSGVGMAARDDFAILADRQGIMMSDVAPVTEGALAPGVARVVVTRATATVPNCPNWDSKSDANPHNATSKGFGCAINGNLAAMVADPEDLLRGQKGSGETVVMTSNRAIDIYRNKEPTGAGELKVVKSDE